MNLKRCPNNPILKPTKNKWENNEVFNPGVVFFKGKIHMLYRATSKEDKNYISRLGYAVSEDGFQFKRRSEPILKLRKPYEKWGMEDPRITKIDGICYITYVVLKHPANSGYATPQTAVMSTRDFKKFKRLGKITSPGADDKDVVLFPEKIKGRYTFLHRPNLWTGEKYETAFPSIWISHAHKFKKLWHPELLIKPKFAWEELKIGSGPPPIKTKKGWLLIYHGVSNRLNYRVTAALLDLNDPRKVIARLDEPILKPENSYEIRGEQGIVFPTGAILREGRLIVYYGAADKYVCAAYCNLEELLSCFKKR